VFVANGEWKVRLVPGNNTMHYDQTLHSKLEAVLGKGAVEVQVLER